MKKISSKEDLYAYFSSLNKTGKIELMDFLKREAEWVYGYIGNSEYFSRKGRTWCFSEKVGLKVSTGFLKILQDVKLKQFHPITIDIMALLGHSKALKHLLKRIESSKSIKEKKETILLLGELEGKRSQRELRKLVDKVPNELKESVIESLAKTGSPCHGLIYNIVISHKDVNTRIAALRALRKCIEVTKEYLVKAIDSKNEEEKIIAMECVAEFNQRDFIPKLFSTYNTSKTEKIKICAAKALLELNNTQESKAPEDMNDEEFEQFVENM